MVERKSTEIVCKKLRMFILNKSNLFYLGTITVQFIQSSFKDLNCVVSETVQVFHNYLMHCNGSLPMLSNGGTNLERHKTVGGSSLPKKGRKRKKKL